MKRHFVYILLLLIAMPAIHARSGGYWGVGLGSGLAGFAVGRATSQPRTQYVQEPVYVERQVPVYVDRPAYQQSSGSQVNQLRQQLAQKENQIDSLYAENDQQKTELRESGRRLQRLQKENNDLRAENQRLKSGKSIQTAKPSIDDAMSSDDKKYHEQYKKMSHTQSNDPDQIMDVTDKAYHEQLQKNVGAK